MKFIKILSLILLITLISCNKTNNRKIQITNTLNFERSFETITISKADLLLGEDDNLYNYAITNSLDIQQTIQYEDLDGDSVVDSILFQPIVGANTEATYNVTHTPNVELPEQIITCYARFVPERTDDYAWENDKVAFRVYGPTAQKMKEESIEGGTLSSGVDCWLKRVEYPIINKWYKKYTDKTGTYHKDTGEGLDNYHVGTSSGCGGIAIKKDTTYYTSKNYINYKTITTGPIRTQFSLEYATWDVDGNPIKENRIITLDKGNNLSKFDISLEGTDQVSIGLTLHKNDGTITKNKKNGWISYWENLDDSQLGTAVIIDSSINEPKNESKTNSDIVGFDTYLSTKDDVKNQFITIKVRNKSIRYYAGFGWKKSKQFQNIEQWNTYLDNFSKQIQTPLTITIN